MEKNEFGFREYQKSIRARLSHRPYPCLWVYTKEKDNGSFLYTVLKMI